MKKAKVCLGFFLNQQKAILLSPQFHPHLSPAPSHPPPPPEIMSDRYKEQMRDRNPPDGNKCSFVAPPPYPPCIWSVPREGNPRMVLSQH